MSNQPIIPGEFICDELQERGWSASDLALKMNIPLDELEGILRGEAHISPKIAALLAAALDIDAQFWLNLEAECGLARTQPGKPS